MTHIGSILKVGSVSDRRSRSVALIGVVGLLLTACGGSSTPQLTTATFESAPCPSPNVPGLPQLDLGPEFSCGDLSVPENRSKPDGRKIKVAVARVKAASPSPKPDPLVYLTGGPGGPGLAAAQVLVNDGINRDRDVIFVDQRGTLHSDPKLTCPEIDDFNLKATGTSIQAPSTADADLVAVRACHDRLAAAGYDLSAYNTTENAADIADLRTALHINQWNVYGVSYGSDLALQLLRDHPDGIRSVVVDSLLPPQTNFITEGWPAAAEGFRALFDACAAQPGCAAAYPNLSDEFTSTVARLAKQPLTVGIPAANGQPPRRVVIDGYTLANVVVQASLAPGKFAALPKTIHSIASGDGAAAAADVVGGLTPPGIVAYGLTYGVFCREHAAFANPAIAAATAQQALPEFPPDVLGLIPQAPRLFGECDLWDVGHADDAVHQPARSGVPVLLLNGTLDAVTPPSQADEAAATLPHARVVRFRGLGHDVLPTSDCARQIVAEFLNRPDNFDTRCADAMQPPTFVG